MHTIKLYSAILFFAVIGNTIPIALYGQPLTASLTISATPSPYLSDWSDGREKIELTISTSSPVSIVITGQIARNGNRIVATKATSPIRRSVPAGTTIINGADILTPSSIEFFGTNAEQYQRLGMLPEGAYELCVRIETKGTTPSTGNQPVESCASFTIRSLQPPILIAPAQGSKVNINTPINFLWSDDQYSPGIRYNVSIYPASYAMASQAPQRSLIRLEATGTSVLWNAAGVLTAPTTLRWEVERLGSGGASRSESRTMVLTSSSGTSTITSPKTVVPDITPISTEGGPCDTIDIHISNLRNELQTATATLSQSQSAYSASLRKADSLRQLRKQIDSLREAYWSQSNKLFGEYLRSQHGQKSPQIAVLRRMADSLMKVSWQLRDSIYYYERSSRDLQHSARSQEIEAESINRSIAYYEELCKRVTEDRAYRQRRIHQATTTATDCIKKMQSLRTTAQQTLDSLRAIGRNSPFITDLENELQRQIDALNRAIATGEKGLSEALTAADAGNTALLYGLDNCFWAEMYIGRTRLALNDLKNEFAKAEEAEAKARREREEQQRKAREDEAKRKQEEAERQRTEQEWQVLQDNFKNSFDQIFDALEPLDKASEGVNFLRRLKESFDGIMTVVDFVGWLQSIPQNYINFLTAYKAALLNPSDANILELAEAFCQLANISGHDAKTQTYLSFKNHMPGIIRNMSEAAKKQMVSTIDQIIHAHGKAK